MLKKKGLTLEKALDKFTEETHQVIRAKHRTPLVWQEMVSLASLSVVPLQTELSGPDAWRTGFGEEGYARHHLDRQ